GHYHATIQAFRNSGYVLPPQVFFYGYKQKQDPNREGWQAHVASYMVARRTICSMSSGQDQGWYADRFSQTIQPYINHLHACPLHQSHNNLTYSLHQSHDPKNKTQDRLDSYPSHATLQDF
uniref:Uncharacterized protein n=2 Tax=Aegilops tauschii subsp. strangulata TaxID=200361 RepID=A0A453RUB8_AEGTS